MNRATPQMRNFAERVMAQEAAAALSFGNDLSGAFLVPDRLRPHLSTLMGNSGYRALLLRSIALAREEVFWLRDVGVAHDGSLEGLDPLDPPEPGEVREGGVVLVAHMIALLVSFIGERLTQQLAGEVWPELGEENLNFRIGNKK